MDRSVQTKFKRRARKNYESEPSDVEVVSLFPNRGVPLGWKRTYPFNLDNNSLSQASTYLFVNYDEVQEYIRYLYLNRVFVLPS